MIVFYFIHTTLFTLLTDDISWGHGKCFTYEKKSFSKKFDKSVIFDSFRFVVFRRLWGRLQMTSAIFVKFLTPFLPCPDCVQEHSDPPPPCHMDTSHVCFGSN